MVRDHYKRYRQLPAYDEVRRRLTAGLSLVHGQTVGEWLDEWLAGKRKISSNTHRSYESHLRLYLQPELGHLPLDKLRAPHIRAAYDRIIAGNAERARPVGPTSLHRIHETLRSSLNDAVRQRRLADNPALHVEVEKALRPKPKVWTARRVIHWLASGERPPVTVWTPEQTGAFLDHIAADRLYAYYHLQVFRGPRRGEGVGLRWTELDLDAAVMTVTEQIVQVGWATETSTPKADSEGLVALDSVTVEVLRAHAARQATERQQSGEAWTNSGYVFTTEDGRPVHPDYVSRHFVRVVRQANRLRAAIIHRPVDATAALAQREFEARVEDGLIYWDDPYPGDQTRRMVHIGDRAIPMGSGCGPDVFTFAAVLDVPFGVEDTCPTTGTPIRVDFVPGGVERVDPPEAVTVLLHPKDFSAAIGGHFDEINAAVCTYQPFFASAEAAEPALVAFPGSRAFTVKEMLERPWFTLYRDTLRPLIHATNR